jgi:hypothetical protein
MADALLHHKTPEEGAGCIMCAVRALTEGEPAVKWQPNPGQSVSGVVLRIGHLPSPFGRSDRVLFVDLWTGGTGRIRVLAYAASLDNALRTAEALVGDRLTLTRGEDGTLTKGMYAGRTYKTFTAEVRRGHH